MSRSARRTPPWAAVALAAALAAAGCGAPRVIESGTYMMKPGEPKVLDLPAAPKNQRVTVEFASSEGEVSVYLLRDFDAEGPGDTPPPREKTLRSARGASGSISSDVPAGAATRVILRDVTRPTAVAVTVTDRK